MEETIIFKSYLRRLPQDFQDLQEALKNQEYDKASHMTEKWMEDTQRGIEDN